MFSDASVYLTLTNAVRIICCLVLLGVVLGFKPIRKSKKRIIAVGLLGLGLITGMVVATHMNGDRLVAEEDEYSDFEDFYGEYQAYNDLTGDEIYDDADEEWDEDAEWDEFSEDEDMDDEYARELTDSEVAALWRSDEELDAEEYWSNYDNAIAHSHDDFTDTTDDDSDTDSGNVTSRDDRVLGDDTAANNDNHGAYDPDEDAYTGLQTSYEFPEMSEDVYISKVLGIGYAIDSDWSFADEAKLAKHDGVSASNFRANLYGDIMSGNGYRSEMFTESDDGYKTIGVTVLYIGGANPRAKLEELFGSSGITSKNVVVQKYGAVDAQITSENTEFCGKTAKKAHLKVTYANGAVLYSDVVVFVNNGFAGIVTTNSVNKDLPELLDNFMY